MGLSAFDLQQIDGARLGALSAEQKDALILKLVRELQDALDRLNQTPHNIPGPTSPKSLLSAGEAIRPLYSRLRAQHRAPPALAPLTHY